MGDALFEEWQIYEKLLIHDYMDHHAFFARLGEEITHRFDHPITLLDLGCGDLKPILPLLTRLPIRRYLGVDESDVALGLAARNLKDHSLPGELICGDFVETLEGMAERFDVIVASFSMHHLPEPADKLRALRAGRRLLAPDGLFALIDVFCDENETREHYLERWVSNAQSRYREVGPGEREILFSHVRERDYPISPAAYENLGGLAGLEGSDMLLRDKEQLNGLMLFSCGVDVVTAQSAGPVRTEPTRRQKP